MNLNHRIGSVAFGLLVGLIVATWSYQWLTNPAKQSARELEERVVLTARELLAVRLGLVNPDVVDPLAVNRKVGKVYIYPSNGGWEVSGFYRRSEDDRWHAYLMSIDGDYAMSMLKVNDSDSALVDRARSDPLLEVMP